MKFLTPLTALEFYLNHRLGGGQPVSHGAICTAADIESILGTFPGNVQRALIDYAWHGIKTSFTPAALRLFKNMLDSAGYLKNEPSEVAMHPQPA